MNKFLVVVINGPPASGKDTISQRVVSESHPYMMLGGKKVMFWQEKMSEPLKDAICAFFNITSYFLEMNKDLLIEGTDCTLRDAIISLDLMWVRPQFGEDFLGHLMVKSLKMRKMEKLQDATHVFLVDAGVDAEVEMLKLAFGKYLKVVHLHREGKTFTDSRTYLSQCDAHLYNDDHISIVVNRLCLLVNKWLEEINNDKFDAGTPTGISQTKPLN